MINLFYESSTRTSSSFELLRSASRRTDVGEGGRLVGRQGRVAEGHGADARRVRPGRDRDPAPAGRRAAARRAVLEAAGRQRRRRQAPAPDPGAARPLHDAGGVRSLEGCTWRSSATCSLARRALARAGARARRRPRDARRAAVAPAARGRVARLRARRTDIAAVENADCVYVLRMQRERMESPRSEPPRVRRALGITPERIRPGQKVMHPGPINRGVEIDGRVADSPRVADPRAGARRGSSSAWPSCTICSQARRPCRSRRWRHEHARLQERPLGLARRRGRLRGGECVAVTVTDGGSADEPRPHRRVLAPAFVDPHVHLRTPGREDEETIASGTAAAAAGGYCAIVAMPNTDPVVDSAAVLRGSRRAGRAARRVVPVGFMAAITTRARGEELTEMGELADAGAAGVHGRRPTGHVGRMMRRALQYGAITGRKLALHCEEPTLSRDGQVHEGAVSAELGLRRLPVGGRERDGRAGSLPRRVRAAPDPPDAPVGARVGRGAGGRRRRTAWRRPARSRRTTRASPTRRSARSTRT